MAYFNPYYPPYMFHVPAPGPYYQPYGAQYNMPEQINQLPPKPDTVQVVRLIRDGFDENSKEPQHNINYTPYEVELDWTGNKLIERAGGEKGWGILEVYEHGNGIWQHGRDVKHGSDVAKKTLKDYGFKRKTPIYMYLREKD